MTEMTACPACGTFVVPPGSCPDCGESVVESSRAGAGGDTVVQYRLNRLASASGIVIAGAVAGIASLVLGRGAVGLTLFALSLLIGGVQLFRR